MNSQKLTTFYKPLTDEQINKFINDKNLKYTFEEIKELNNKKVELINEQINNFGVYLHYDRTYKFKSSFNLINEITYNDIIIKSLDEFKEIFTYKNIYRLNYTEHLYLNETRIFFDIDYEIDTPENYEMLNKLIMGINWFKDTYKLNLYGVIEVKNEKYESYLSESWENVLIFNNENLTKCLSGHVFLDGYTNRSQLSDFMKNYFKNKFELTDNKIFDGSVYKTTKQGLRCSFSPKISTEKLKDQEIENDKINKINNNGTYTHIRQIPKEELKEMLKHPEIFYNLRMAPTKTDKFIDLSEYLIIEQQKQTNQNKQIKTRQNKTNKPKNQISIFQYINTDDKIINIEKIYNEKNNFNYSSLLLPYIQTVLTPEEVENEIRKIKISDEILEESKHKPLNDWFDELIGYIKKLIKQDYTNINTLYNLIDYNNQIIKDNENDKEIINDCMKRKTLLSTYIERYEKYNFMTHEFYEHTDPEFGTYTKKERLIYNHCFIGDKIYNVYDEKFYDKITDFKTKFKLNGDTLKEIEEKIPVFDNFEQFRKIKTETDILKLSYQQLQEYKNNFNEFLKMLRSTFKYEDDYKFYLSYFAKKLTSKHTINKGLINQGTEKKGAHDAFKTYFNDLLEDYIISAKCDYQNFNKPLNGSYLKGQLCIIEELPKEILNANDFINRLKSLSETDTIRIEEKNINSYSKINDLDFIINTNHTVRKIFNNENDCGALLKRFRILTRLSVKWTEEHKKLIQTISQNKKLYGYLLKEHLINEIKPDYFNEHFKDTNDIMKTYKEQSMPDSETNKTSNDDSLKYFINNFEEKYCGPSRKIKITALYNYLVEKKAIEKIKSKVLKQCLITLLQEEKRDNLITVSTDKNKDIFINDKMVKCVAGLIYKQYFEESNITI